MRFSISSVVIVNLSLTTTQFKHSLLSRPQLLESSNGDEKCYLYIKLEDENRDFVYSLFVLDKILPCIVRAIIFFVIGAFFLFIPCTVLFVYHGH